MSDYGFRMGLIILFLILINVFGWYFVNFVYVDLGNWIWEEWERLNIGLFVSVYKDVVSWK